MRLWAILEVLGERGLAEVAFLGRARDANPGRGLPHRVCLRDFDPRGGEGLWAALRRRLQRSGRRFLGVRRDPLVLDAATAERLAERIVAWRGGSAPRCILASRLATAPLGLALARRWPGARLVLDLDDVESTTVARIAAMERARGLRWSARWREADARSLAVLEAELLERFSAVAVSGAGDRASLAERFPGVDVVWWPNRVRLPEAVLPPPAAGFVVLFVGTLRYLPNLDAVERLAFEVLPALRRAVPEAVVEVVGQGLPRRVQRRVAGTAGLEVRGFVQDLGPTYGGCSAVVVPLRAGGGTRIKILEAWAHGRPVVSSAVGIEGLEAVEGVHYLGAETAEETVAALARLRRSPGLAADLAERGRAMVGARYGLSRGAGLPGLDVDA